MMMSRTACCFVALGISFAAFAAACGDDDGGGGIGGNGGGGGSGGGGGTAGSGSAGTAGAAGSGSVEEGDAGPDSGTGNEPDSGVEVDAGGGTTPDAAVVNGDCTGFTTGIANIDTPNNQDVVIARVIFAGDDTTAHVVLRVVGALGFNFGGGQQLCWGATNAECAEVDDGVPGVDQPVGFELTVDIGTDDDPVTPDEGEILFVNDFPANDPQTPYAYLNWGDHDSADPDGGGTIGSLETIADGAGFWTAGASVTLTGAQNAIFVNGDTTVDTGFGVCTATDTD
jgi:hypothetical protein